MTLSPEDGINKRLPMYLRGGKSRKIILFISGSFIPLDLLFAYITTFHVSTVWQIPVHSILYATACSTLAMFYLLVSTTVVPLPLLYICDWLHISPTSTTTTVSCNDLYCFVLLCDFALSFRSRIY